MKLKYCKPSWNKMTRLYCQASRPVLYNDLHVSRYTNSSPPRSVESAQASMMRVCFKILLTCFSSTLEPCTIQVQYKWKISCSTKFWQIATVGCESVSSAGLSLNIRSVALASCYFVAGNARVSRIKHFSHVLCTGRQSQRQQKWEMNLKKKKITQPRLSILHQLFDLVCKAGNVNANKNLQARFH